MRVFLDTNIVIYSVEGAPAFWQRASRNLAQLETAGHEFVISDLVRLECLIKPFDISDGDLLLDYCEFFADPRISTVALTAAVHDRAAQIRASHRYVGGRRYSLADALHLSTAIESGCGEFLTHDTRLNAFRQVRVRVLPQGDC